MKVQEKLKQFQLERKAILATNFYNYETLKGILEAASRVQAPVMLQLTKSSIDYMGLKRAVVLARQGLEDYRLDGCIHLDHGGSVELVQRCLDAGFESVMIDASEKSMEENIETTCKVVEMARPYGANVEAELGYARFVRFYVRGRCRSFRPGYTGRCFGCGYWVGSWIL